MANVSDELLQLRKRARRRLVGAITLVIFALTFLWTVLDGEPPKNLVESHPVEIISTAPALSSVVSSAPETNASAASMMVAAPVEMPIEASKVAPVALPGKLVTHQSKAAELESTHGEAIAEHDATAAPVVEKSVVEKSEPIKVTPTKAPAVKPTQKATPTKAPVVAAPKVDPKSILEGKTVSADAPAVKKAAETASASKQYYIQIGAYADAEKAAQLHAKLKSSGVKVTSEKISTSKGELTRIRVGPTNDEVKAKAWVKVLADLGVSGTLIAKAAP